MLFDLHSDGSRAKRREILRLFFILSDKRDREQGEEGLKACFGNSIRPDACRELIDVAFVHGSRIGECTDFPFIKLR